MGWTGQNWRLTLNCVCLTSAKHKGWLCNLYKQAQIVSKYSWAWSKPWHVDNTAPCSSLSLDFGLLVRQHEPSEDISSCSRNPRRALILLFTGDTNLFLFVDTTWVLMVESNVSIIRCPSGPAATQGHFVIPHLNQKPQEWSSFHKHMHALLPPQQWGHQVGGNQGQYGKTNKWTTVLWGDLLPLSFVRSAVINIQKRSFEYFKLCVYHQS